VSTTTRFLVGCARTGVVRGCLSTGCGCPGLFRVGVHDFSTTFPEPRAAVDPIGAGSWAGSDQFLGRDQLRSPLPGDDRQTGLAALPIEERLDQLIVAASLAHGNVQLQLPARRVPVEPEIFRPVGERRADTKNRAVLHSAFLWSLFGVVGSNLQRVEVEQQFGETLPFLRVLPREQARIRRHFLQRIAARTQASRGLLRRCAPRNDELFRGSLARRLCGFG